MPFWPLNQKLNRNIDKLSAIITTAINCRRDDALNWARFPGESLLVSLPVSSHTSVYWWETQSIGVAVAGGNVYRVLEDGSYIAITGATLALDTPVSFADYGTALYMAAGGRIVKWTGAVTASYLDDEDADAPTNVYHLAVFDTYLLALDADGILWHSDTALPGTWLGEYVTAESQPDKSIAMMVGWEEVAVFGTQTIQSFYNSGAADGPIESINGSTLEVGVIARHSVCKLDNAYFFLDNERRVQRLRGRQNQVVSEQIHAELNTIGRVDDARGFPLTCDGETYYCIVFPTDGIGWAYDYKRDDWTRFADFDTGEYVTPNIHSAAYCKTWHKHIAGSSDGRVYLVSTAYNTPRMELRIRVGFDTFRWKFCNTLKMKIKRGYGTSSATLLVSYRDNGKAIWSNEKSADLGLLEHDQECFITFRRLGRYREREWRVVITDNVPMLLIGVEEDVSLG